MPQHLETLLDNIERDALGLDTSHISHIYESKGLALGRSLPDNRNQHLRLHPDVLASAERTLTRSFELIRFTEAPKCIGAGQAPFSLPIAETSTVETTQQQQTVTSPISSVTSTSGGAKRVLSKTGIITNEVELARSSLLTMLRGNDSFDNDDDDDNSSAAIALAVANGGSRNGQQHQ